MITVIRIEHPNDGHGLWRARDNDGTTFISRHSKFKVIEQRHNGDDFPTYWGDHELMRSVKERDGQSDPMNYHFAFLSLEQVIEALTLDEIKECINLLGFKVLMLTVTEYHVSAYQAIYKKESVTEEKDITFLFI